MGGCFGAPLCPQCPSAPQFLPPNFRPPPFSYLFLSPSIHRHRRRHIFFSSHKVPQAVYLFPPLPFPSLHVTSIFAPIKNRGRPENMPTATDSSAAATAKNGGGGGAGAGTFGGGLFHFRRAQSLRFPRSSTAGGHCPSASSSASVGANNFSRTGSRNYRSKSSRHRFGSIEAQSLLGRMSAGQRIALVGTWRQMRHQQAQLAALMRKCLIELEQTEPIVKEIFYKAGYVDCWEKVSAGGCGANPATLDEHVRLMAKFFDDLVAFVEAAGPNGIDGGEEITAKLKTLGQQHAFLAHTSGLPPDVWDKLGEIAVDKICAVECVQRTREAGRAWRTLIAFWTDKIRCGFEGEVKAFSRRPSTEVQSSSYEAAAAVQCEELGKRLQQLRMAEHEHGPRENGNGGGAVATHGANG